jgi:hypothetical protein
MIRIKGWAEMEELLPERKDLHALPNKGDGMAVVRKEIAKEETNFRVKRNFPKKQEQFSTEPKVFCQSNDSVMH